MTWDYDTINSPSEAAFQTNEPNRASVCRRVAELCELLDAPNARVRIGALRSLYECVSVKEPRLMDWIIRWEIERSSPSTGLPFGVLAFLSSSTSNTRNHLERRLRIYRWIDKGNLWDREGDVDTLYGLLRGIRNVSAWPRNYIALLPLGIEGLRRGSQFRYFIERFFRPVYSFRPDHTERSLYDHADRQTQEYVRRRIVKLLLNGPHGSGLGIFARRGMRKIIAKFIDRCENIGLIELRWVPEILPYLTYVSIVGPTESLRLKAVKLLHNNFEWFPCLDLIQLLVSEVTPANVSLPDSLFSYRLVSSQTWCHIMRKRYCT